ncbi:MAG: hypothetical protein PHR35_18210 [Kiritimatiellae bacterium]|nr:hypothetical protein [Kiritimatiellia bacterium]
MGHYSWDEGYDKEYEYSVEVTDDRILWHLQFDPQWSDPPQDETQSFEDFLAHGHPSGFSGACDDDIRKEVLGKIKAAGYRPYPASGGHVPLSEIPAADGPMKISWARTAGAAEHTVDINATEVVVATSYGNPHAGGGGASCSHADFLNGRHHRIVRDLFGEGTLREIISYVKRAGAHPEFIAIRSKLDVRKQFILDIPEDRRIKGIVEHPALVDGYTCYGNCGGYDTACVNGRHRFYMGKLGDFVEDTRTKKRSRFQAPGSCVSVVGLDARFYFVSWDNFWVVDAGGRTLFETYSLKDQSKEPIFGGALRADRTYRLKRNILVHVWWVCSDLPDSYLRFHPEKLKFTGRYDAPR